jgi:hypothetical protein
MSVILQLWWQIQYTFSSLRNVNCGPEHIQWTYSSTYSGFNIQLNVAVLLLEICRECNAPYTAIFVPNTAHIHQITLSEFWSRPYTVYLQLHIFRIQYSTERICADSGDMSTIQYALYWKHGAKYSAHPPVYIMWTVVPVICNVVTAPHIQALIFNWTNLRCYLIYLDNSVRDILQTGSQIQRTSSSLRCENCGPGHIQCIYSSAYSGVNNQLNVSPLLLEISRQLHACYTANLVTNTAHTLQFTLCELWSRTYTM